MAAITFHILLKSDTIKLPDIKRFLGKNVRITVTEAEPVKRPRDRQWNHLGMADFNGSLDAKNIRDLAYE